MKEIVYYHKSRVPVYDVANGTEEERILGIACIRASNFQKGSKYFQSNKYNSDFNSDKNDKRNNIRSTDNSIGKRIHTVGNNRKS